MTMPASYPLQLYHGDSYEWQFKLWLDEGKTAPLDLDDVVAKAEIRETSGATPIWTIDCTVIPPNTIVATLSAATCVTLPLGNLVWDLQLTYTLTGAVNTVLSGTVSVTADVTDSISIEPEVLQATAAPAIVSMRAARKK